MLGSTHPVRLEKEDPNSTCAPHSSWWGSPPPISKSPAWKSFEEGFRLPALFCCQHTMDLHEHLHKIVASKSVSSFLEEEKLAKSHISSPPNLLLSICSSSKCWLFFHGSCQGLRGYWLLRRGWCRLCGGLAAQIGPPSKFGWFAAQIMNDYDGKQILQSPNFCAFALACCFLALVSIHVPTASNAVNELTWFHLTCFSRESDACTRVLQVPTAKDPKGPDHLWTGIQKEPKLT